MKDLISRSELFNIILKRITLMKQAINFIGTNHGIPEAVLFPGVTDFSQIVTDSRGNTEFVVNKVKESLAYALAKLSSYQKPG